MLVRPDRIVSSEPVTVTTLKLKVECCKAAANVRPVIIDPIGLFCLHVARYKRQPVFMEHWRAVEVF